MNLFNTKLHDSFQSREVIKVITGIDNVDISQIVTIAKSAELSGATYLDVVANPKVVKLLKSTSALPVCVSSVSTLDLYNCFVAGADLIEIGNFDACYTRGIYFSPDQILSLVKEVKSLVDTIDLCVTIPYHLSLNDQIRLAQSLEFIGVNIIQTEAIFIKNKPFNSQVLGSNIFNLVYPSYSSLLSTYFISTSVQIPVITSSRINTFSGTVALLLGASGIGVGSTIKNQDDLSQMSDYIKLLRDSINFVVDEQSLVLNHMLHSSILLSSNTI
uniref:Uncharacterized protein ycf23 n=1 Tax=Laurenciella marilzae TaxID=1413812 RepID=A0A1Z1M1U1_9FLOR|nr:hypothetical protein [Laurenciella marilzae]ARW59743.1 hypothetical protein [Laurenciella marilzae]